MIKRYLAQQDTTISNAYGPNLTTRATGSNMGESDVLEIFHIYAQESSGSHELSRILMKFPIDTILSDRNKGDIPVSGSVNFHLRLYNAEHSFTLPRSTTIITTPISSPWNEGTGLDMESYKDIGTSNWVKRDSTNLWNTSGGDFLSGTIIKEQFFDRGTEDLNINITDIVEDWIAGVYPNNGLGIMLSSSQETDSDTHFTKKFFARGTEFFYRRPSIDAIFDDSISDDRSNFYLSSSLATSSDNLNTLYLYNIIRGQLTNIPSVGTGSIYLRIYNSSTGGTEILATTPQNPITGVLESTGIYRASFALETSEATVYDRWFKGSTYFFTGSFKPINTVASSFNINPTYVSNITNLKNIYFDEEVARFRVFIRERDWHPTIYTVASSDSIPKIIDKAFYKIERIIDGAEVIPYGTGSIDFTKLSYDSEGNYFDLNCSFLESGYAYSIKLAYYINNKYVEQPEKFKFRVEKSEKT